MNISKQCVSEATAHGSNARMVIPSRPAKMEIRIQCMCSTAKQAHRMMRAAQLYSRAFLPAKTLGCHPNGPKSLSINQLRLGRSHEAGPAGFQRAFGSLQHVNLASTATRTASTMTDLTFLGQEEAQELDADLMGELGFSVDQLMELAGLSVASALHLEYGDKKRVLVLVGPGNNGGDGLVAARHLYHFGHQVEVCYPKRTDKPLFQGLVKQVESLGARFIEPDELQAANLSQQADVVLDALFGFSFKGPPRAPLDKLLDAIKPHARPPPVVSVDIPSGWDVEKGDVSGDGIKPDMLVSLTAPKLCTKHFQGIHYLGGRFVPPIIKEKYNLEKLPQYKGVDQCVRVN